MSKLARAKQWATFARQWHLFDATWQNPIMCAPLIAKYLKGEHKPIYSPIGNCGDHVVIINTKQIAFPGQEWRFRAYFHDTMYPKGKSYTRAWELHDRDPTLIMWFAIKSQLGHNLLRPARLQHLHLFPDDKIPEEFQQNITNQIRPLRLVPRHLDSYTEEEIKNFPKVFDYPAEYEPR